MNDGQHKETIERNAVAAEAYIENATSRQPNKQRPREIRFENDTAHLVPSRWWFASSAFPMIAATLGPVASAFSICALGSQWRQHVTPGKSIDQATFIEDPAWLTIVNAIQLAVALVSNAFLLLNMTKRIRFSIAQPITIIGWYISAICLVSLTAIAAGPLLDGLDPPQDYVWSQAFYYGIWAAILYFFDASLMVVTFWGASSGHYAKDFNLTPSQRTLMLQTILFLSYLLLGALVFSHIQDWHYLDAVYWANVTLFTVGFGDFSPTTNLSKALLLPYALIGVISLGLVISSIRSMILERGRRRLDARMEEKNRRRIIRTMAKTGHDEILSPIRNVDSLEGIETSGSNLPQNEFDRRRTEFLLMRKIQQQAAIRRKWLSMIISGSVWVLLWLVGAVIFMHCEKPYQQWTYFDSFYFCFVSLTTIGYGDYAPQSNGGKAFFVFWSLLALPTMTVLISNAGDTVVKYFRDATIRVGTITILPGEEGFTGNAKYIANRLTLGRTFRHATNAIREREMLKRQIKRTASIAGFYLGDVDDTTKQKNHSREGSGTYSHSHGDEGLDRQGQHKFCEPAAIPAERPSLSQVRDHLDDLPTGTDLHILLSKEIQLVSQHLRESEPRRYTFEEWAWYLGLMGEDERDPMRHRKAVPKEKHKRRNRVCKHDRRKESDAESQFAHSHSHAPEVDLDNAPPGAVEAAAELGMIKSDRMKWSWVGIRSPLMGGQEESEWIMDKLMERLQESLWETKIDEEGDV
ncbi:hypothetical protein E4U21_003721 [Claviceps maximensis]|nr:hypothetical protein E4U21_003721 [Claviceps maximensis]